MNEGSYKTDNIIRRHESHQGGRKQQDWVYMSLSYRQRAVWSGRF